MNEKLRVLLVDDELAVRRGVRMRLTVEADIDVVGEAGNGLAAFELAGLLRPDLVLMDVRMPRLDGIAAAASIRAALPDTRILLLTMQDDASTRLQAKRAGADALVSKHLIDQTLLPAIRELCLGDV